MKIFSSLKLSEGGDFYSKALLAKTLSKLELMPHLILWKADSEINCYERFSFENTSCITVIFSVKTQYHCNILNQKGHIFTSTVFKSRKSDVYLEDFLTRF